MSEQTYATGKPLPPQSEWVTRIFFREGFFYPIELPEDDNLNHHTEMNPGTLRVEDVNGNILWPKGTKQ